MQQTELIKVTQNEQGEIVVSGRDLHEFLEVKEKYTQWFDRMAEYEFAEGVDYVKTSIQKNGKTTTEGFVPLSQRKSLIDHILTLDMAKEVAMIQRTPKGKQARQYFIAVEKEYKNQQLNVAELSPQLQMFNQLFLSQAQTEKAVAELEAKVDSISQTVAVNIRSDWRKQTHHLINCIAGTLGSHSFGYAKSIVFSELEARAGINLKTRLSNMKKRSREAGATAVAVQRLNTVDVIAADKQLIEIYIAVVKEFAIQYNVYQNQLEYAGGTAA